MQAYECRGWVQLQRPDGSSLGEAKAQISVRQEADGRLGWRGVLRAGITPTTKLWPADEPVVLHCPDGRDLTVCLEPAIVERGPVLLQVAHARQVEAAAHQASPPEQSGKGEEAAYVRPHG
jgi:hypothetical protein